MKKKNNKIFLIILLIVAVALIAGYFLYQNNFFSFKQEKRGITCIADTRNCPDGSSVGRVPPNCEFTPCPDFTAGWQTYKNNQYGFEMKYPSDFFDSEQQPKLLIGDCNYNVFPDKCPNINGIVADDQIADGSDASVIMSNLANPGYWDNPNGVKQKINNNQFCLYTTGDAATGHAFNYYYFATVKNQKCLVVYLATSTENCDFYLPLEKGNTEQTKNYNNCVETNKVQPTILNELISTFKFN
jgi:hypothetical protein